MTLRVTWIDRKRGVSTLPSDPNYPNGMDINLTAGAGDTCSTALPYPASGIGIHVITCDQCGLRTAVTAAGRIDDPKSVKVACKAR